MQAMRLTIAAAILAGVLSSCSGGDAATPKGSRGRIVDSSGGTVALGLDAAGGYRPGTVSGGGAIAGRVLMPAPPPDSLVPVTRDARVCGDSARVLEVSGSQGSLAHALVWIEGIAAGKPLPELRRQSMTIEKCRFEPRVLATVSGTTINVFSRDGVVHDIRFYREGAVDAVAYARMVDDGQVVPSEHIAASPGIVEARCTMHPWVRGYVAVFQHPYFAVTDEQGAFRIDGLPAGTYRVRVWHQGMERPVEQRVTVGASGVGQVDLAVALNGSG
jgi:hypothetical protein